jgi:hypothetical protein
LLIARGGLANKQQVAVVLAGAAESAVNENELQKYGTKKPLRIEAALPS